MNHEEDDNFILDLLDDPLDKLIIQLLDLEEDPEEIMKKILSRGVKKHD
jgi:hypothetical protein